MNTNPASTTQVERTAAWRGRAAAIARAGGIEEALAAGLPQYVDTTLSEAIVTLRERMGDEIHIKVRDFLQVHGKGGSPCPRCGTIISEIRARNRLTNFCRTCQPGKMIGG